MEEETKKPEEIAQETPTSADAEDVPATPKKKRRWLKRILITLGAILAAILIVVAFFLGPIVKFAVNTFGSSFLGVDRCSIETAKIYPFTGHVYFEKILVGKPIAKGAAASAFSYDLFSVDLVDVDVELISLLRPKKVLEHLEIRNVAVNYEQLFDGQANILVLLKNITGDPKPEEEVAKTEEKVEEKVAEEPKEIFISAEYFVIDNVKIAAYIRGVPFVFPAMSADFSKGIGMDEDLSPVAFGMKVGGNFMSVIDFFRKSAIGDATTATINAVSDAAVMTGDAAKAAAGATLNIVSDAATLTGDAAKISVGAVTDAAELTGDAAKATVDAVTDTADAILDIFNKKKKTEDEEK